MPLSPNMDRNQPASSTTGILPESPRVAAFVGLPDREAVETTQLPATINAVNSLSLNSYLEQSRGSRAMQLELQDGTLYQGVSFGAEKSVSGELVFQTGMVGYPESITDPSYRGQILVITFPLIGNYGVPSRETADEVLGDLPAHFEATQIHVAAIVVASYCGEDYSHYLATSSLGMWLKEQGIPAMQGVDTRALTKRIREDGSMLGKMLIEAAPQTNGLVNGINGVEPHTKDLVFENIDWIDPNTKNLVADGERFLRLGPTFG